MTDYSSYETIAVDVRKHGVVVMTLNRPDRLNAFDGVMRHEIRATIQQVSADPDARCLVLTGAGRGFCAGADLAADDKRPWPTGPSEPRFAWCVELLEMPKPTIAAINGAAAGGGLGLALLCDIRIASDKALMGEVFVNLGIIPGDGGAWYLPRIVGRAKAFEMAFTGDVLKARECLDIGLVHKIVSHDDLMEACMTMAKKIASKPPEALRMTKRLLKESEAQSLSSSLEMAAGFQALAQSTRDYEEAAFAFDEKRKPVFTGR